LQVLAVVVVAVLLDFSVVLKMEKVEKVKKMKRRVVLIGEGVIPQAHKSLNCLLLSTIEAIRRNCFCDYFWIALQKPWEWCRDLELSSHTRVPTVNGSD
jgi:hypothetical protein